MVEYFDLYLYQLAEADKLYRIKHLERQQAEQYAMAWFDKGGTHDYMLVTEDSTPWMEQPDIIDVNADWIKSNVIGDSK